MFDFNEKRKIRNVVFSKLTIAILLILIVLLSMSVFERFVALRTISEKRIVKEEELRELEQRAAALEADVEFMRHGRGVEEELRNRFDVAKKGEKVIVIVNSEEEGSIEDISSGTNEQTERSFWDFLPFW